VAGMAFGVLFMVPFNARKMYAHHDINAAVPVLEQDLVRLGRDKLQDRVQCLDLVGGCYSALYRLGLVQSTGFTCDLQFFGPDDGKVVPYTASSSGRDPPEPSDRHSAEQRVVPGSSYSFNKLNTWPEFRDYLNSAYRLEATKAPSTSTEAPWLIASMCSKAASRTGRDCRWGGVGRSVAIAHP